MLHSGPVLGWERGDLRGPSGIGVDVMAQLGEAGDLWQRSSGAEGADTRYHVVGVAVDVEPVGCRAVGDSGQVVVSHVVPAQVGQTVGEAYACDGVLIVGADGVERSDGRYVGGWGGG